MKRFYPMGVDLSRKTCLVIGGGKVAERKIERLFEFGAKVLVVSPKITDRAQCLIRQGKGIYLKRRFSKGILNGSGLVFAATSDIQVNREIAREARKKGILVNVAKPGQESSFILPALLKKRGILVSVSTHGRSPLKAKRIKERLERFL